MTDKKTWLIAIVIAIAGFSAQVGLQQWMRPAATKGIYFQAYSTETLMQTVSIEDLRNEPLTSLWNIHIQPPLFDLLRATIAAFYPHLRPDRLVVKVDQKVYLVWAGCFGVLAGLMFLWFSAMNMPPWLSIPGVLLFLAHPATILYTTMLDTTILSSVLIFWAYYLVWRQAHNPQASIVPLVIAVLALFFTRSIFQWPAILVFAFSLLLFRVRLRKVVLFFLIVGGISGLYLVKQNSQFGLLSTSSFTGLNLNRSIGYDEMGTYWRFGTFLGRSDVDSSMPKVLTRRRKVSGTPNFNNAAFLGLNRQLKEAFTKRLKSLSISQLVSSYLDNLNRYFLPSSSYSKDVIVERLPWRNIFDKIFSAPILPLLLAAAGLIWLVRPVDRKYATGIGLVLPGLFVFLVSVLFEKGENMRFKFFLEPVFFVFIVSQFFQLGGYLYLKAARPFRVREEEAGRVVAEESLSQRSCL